MRVLFVCTGNTCRSPMAEAICSILAKRRLVKVDTDSAGLFAAAGSPMSFYASEAIKRLYGQEVYHSSKMLSPELVRKSDLIVAMTDAHLAAIRQCFPEAHAISMPCDISDPFGGDLDDYISCAEKLEEGIGILFDRGDIS